MKGHVDFLGITVLQEPLNLSVLSPTLKSQFKYRNKPDSLAASSVHCNACSQGADPEPTEKHEMICVTHCFHP